jgi:putative ABC transport system permease protein
MLIRDIIAMSLESLRAHKMRSALTMLGMIIGVGAVIAMLAVGEGAQRSVEAQIAGLGTNVLIIFPGATTQGGVSSGAGGSTRLTEDDAKAVAKGCPSVEFISPLSRSNAQVIFRDANWSTSITGVYVNYLDIRAWPVARGTMFGESDVRSATKTCLLGATVVQNLFGDEDPIGATIRIRHMPFSIIGVLSPKGQNAQGQDQDDVILAPFGTVQKKIKGVTNADVLLASARTREATTAAQQEMTQVLRVQHRLEPRDFEDFTIRSQTEIAQAAETTSKILTTLLASVASISLLVGGIGIMNIMLVSVTERTREIGIRISLGARRRTILSQFLLEAIALSLSGGLIGIALGAGASAIISSTQGWSTQVTPQAVALAFGFASAVGLFFGWYPARRAAGLNPIEALRYE